MIQVLSNPWVSILLWKRKGMMEFVYNPEFPQIPPVKETSEWTYTMRRTMQEIVPGLYLGPYSVATKSKLDVLLHNGITHVVCVRQDIEAHIIRPNFEDKFKYLVLNIADTATENIIKHFPVVCVFIDEALSNGGKCLVHGNAGISRSAALVMAYIMQKYNLCSRDAFILVQQRRFCINPNDGFMAQLSEFEPIYRAQQNRFNGQCSTENNRNKRRIDDLEETLSDTIENEISDEVEDLSDGPDQFGLNKASVCYGQGETYNPSDLKDCIYLVDKAVQSSEHSPRQHEAMDEELTC